MADFQYKDMCYPLLGDAINAKVASCQPLTANGFQILCTNVTNTGMNVKTYTSATASTNSTIAQTFPPCTYDQAGAIELSWLVIGVFCAAFAVRMVAKVIK